MEAAQQKLDLVQYEVAPNVLHFDEPDQRMQSAQMHCLLEEPWDNFQCVVENLERENKGHMSIA